MFTIGFLSDYRKLVEKADDKIVCPTGRHRRHQATSVDTSVDVARTSVSLPASGQRKR
jgi:hypothetical protein